MVHPEQSPTLSGKDESPGGPHHFCMVYHFIEPGGIYVFDSDHITPISLDWNKYADKRIRNVRNAWPADIGVGYNC